MERGSAIETAEQEEATEANVVVAVAGIAVEIPAARATAGVEGEAEKAIVETSVQPQDREGKKAEAQAAPAEAPPETPGLLELHCFHICAGRASEI